MKKNLLLLLRMVLINCCLAGYASGAIVLLTLHNSEALLDSDGISFLKGNAFGGDLVELILAGPNGMIDPPDDFGIPGGDDTLSIFTNNNPTHVGAGRPSTSNDGFLEQGLISYDDSYVGSTAFVRFWNADTAAYSTGYGNSKLLSLPAAEDIFGFAQLDFAESPGDPHTVSEGWEAIPEPGTLSLLVYGLFLIRYWLRKQQRERSGAIWGLAVLLGLSPFAGQASAQLDAPLDIRAGDPVFDAGGTPLQGSNPHAAAFGGAVVPGCVVQILDAGPDQQAGWPDSDGGVTGDDILLATLHMGMGMPPTDTASGRLAARLYPPPAPGSRLFARVFNAPSVAEATRWGQSVRFTFQPLAVMDLTRLGLWRVTLPVGVDPLTTDSDADGATDFEEWVANTHALDANSRLGAESLRMNESRSGSRIGLIGEAGRRYRLYRSTDPLTGPMNWNRVAESALLSERTELILEDASTEAHALVFYRIEVEIP